MEKKHTKAVLIGGLIGALLGAGAAYTLTQSAKPSKPGAEPNYLKAADLLDLTQNAAKLIRQLDSIRGKVY